MDRNLSVFPSSRFTSLTSTFLGKSASRSLRLWALAKACQCSKRVSVTSRLLPRSCTSAVLTRRLLWLLPQPSVKWAWGSATTCGLRSWHSSTAGKVSVQQGCCLVGVRGSWWGGSSACRRPAAGLPWSLQHDDRPRPLGAPAAGQVRLRQSDSLCECEKTFIRGNQTWAVCSELPVWRCDRPDKHEHVDLRNL